MLRNNEDVYPRDAKHRIFHPKHWKDIDWSTFIHQRNTRKGNINGIQNVFMSPFFRLLEILTGIQIWLLRYNMDIGLIYLVPPLLAMWCVSEYIDWTYGDHPKVIRFWNVGAQVRRELTDNEMEDVAKANLCDMEMKINVMYELMVKE